MATHDTPGMGGSNWKSSEPPDRALDEAGHDARSLGHQASEVGKRAVGAAQERIRSAFEQQTHRAADQLGGVADALHQAAHDISRENDGPVVHYAERAAERMNAVADVLRRSSLDDVVGEVEGFARRQPELFLGGAFAAGFLFARFLKSSADRRSIAQTETRRNRQWTSPLAESTAETGTVGTPGGIPQSAGTASGSGTGMAMPYSRPGTPLNAAPAARRPTSSPMTPGTDRLP